MVSRNHFVILKLFCTLYSASSFLVTHLCVHFKANNSTQLFDRLCRMKKNGLWPGRPMAGILKEKMTPKIWRCRLGPHVSLLKQCQLTFSEGILICGWVVSCGTIFQKWQLWGVITVVEYFFNYVKWCYICFCCIC